MTFIDLSKVKAEAYITESMASSFQKKEQMNITADFSTLPEKTFKPAETFVTQSTADNSLMGGMTGSIYISYPNS